MIIIRKNEGSVRKGTTFTGEVELSTLVKPQREGGMQFTVVHFSDGARTHWHEHPGEQILYILEGKGQVGLADRVEEVETGDAIYTSPGERHWHGAAPGFSMTHISVTNVGSPNWMEPVK